MANPNPEVWGTPDTWVNQNVMYTRPEADFPIIKAGKAKVASFRTLHQGNTENKTVFGETIDSTICPCGQDPAASCFGKIAIFTKKASAPTTPVIVNEFESPVNWCIVENSGGYPFARFQTNFALADDKWSPNTATLATTNRNYNIIPYVFYQLKSLLLRIYVQTFNGYSDSYFGNTPINTAWRTLAEWKNSYSNLKICAIRIDIATVYDADLTNITYAENTVNMNNNTYGTVALIEPIEYNNAFYSDYATFANESKQRFFYIMPYINVERIPSRTKKVVFPCYQMFDNAVMKVTINEDGRVENTWNLWQEVPYTDENYNKIMQMVACFGIPFTDTSKLSFKLDFTDTELCLPVIDENGVTHGEYTRGTANTTNDIYNADSVRDKNYDPTKPPKNNYSDHTDLPSLSWTAANFYTDKTLGTTNPTIDIGALCQAITDLADNPANKDFIFQEPLKNVLEYRRILLSQPWERATSSEPIPLGAFQASAFVGFKNFPRYRRVTLGSFKFDREFENFLDFEPYSQAILYVPFCGVKQLPMSIFAGHQVNIYMNIDNTSGMLQPLIFVDNIEWGTMSGMASEELPLVGETALTAANTKRQLDYQQGQLEWAKMIGMGGSIAGASISAANKNPLGVVAQGASAAFKNYMYGQQQAELQYQINHTKPEPLTIQKGDSSIDKMNVQYPFIMIQSPVLLGAQSPQEIDSLFENYGKTKGFSCCEVGPLGDFSGLTKCSTADLSGISCTYTEKKMIMEALQEGVIL